LNILKFWKNDFNKYSSRDFGSQKLLDDQALDLTWSVTTWYKDALTIDFGVKDKAKYNLIVINLENKHSFYFR